MSIQVKATRKGHRIVSLLIKRFPGLRERLLTDEFEIWDGELPDVYLDGCEVDTVITGVQIIFEKTSDSWQTPFYAMTYENKDEKDIVSGVARCPSVKPKVQTIGLKYIEPAFNRNNLVFKQSWMGTK